MLRHRELRLAEPEPGELSGREAEPGRARQARFQQPILDLGLFDDHELAPLNPARTIISNNVSSGGTEPIQ